MKLLKGLLCWLAGTHFHTEQDWYDWYHDDKAILCRVCGRLCGVGGRRILQ